MKLWLFGVQGSPLLLNGVRNSQSKLVKISITYNFHEQSEYWLDIDNRFFENLSDEEIVSSAKGFLQVVNGYVKLLVGVVYSNSSLGKINYEDAFVYEADNISTIAVDPYSYRKLRITTKSVNYKPFTKIEGLTLQNPKNLIDKAYFEDDVLNLLVLLGEDLNWVLLYSIYDTVKHYSYEKNIRNQVFSVVSGKEISHFTGTANDFKTLGPLARHGMWGNSTPARVICFDEAISIIEKLVYSYFEIAHGVKFSPIIPRSFDMQSLFSFDFDL